MDRIRKRFFARTAVTALMGAALLGVGIASAGHGAKMQLAAMDEDLDTVKQANGIEYACTGVGDEAQEDPRWSEFPAKLVFAEKGGAYLSNVAVRITDAKSGKVVFDGGCRYAPWLVLGLEPGRYEVTAEASGFRTETVTLDVKESGQTERTIHFQAEA